MSNPKREKIEVNLKGQTSKKLFIVIDEIDEFDLTIILSVGLKRSEKAISMGDEEYGLVELVSYSFHNKDLCLEFVQTLKNFIESNNYFPRSYATRIKGNPIYLMNWDPEEFNNLIDSFRRRKGFG